MRVGCDSLNIEKYGSITLPFIRAEEMLVNHILEKAGTCHSSGIPLSSNSTYSNCAF